MRRLQRTAIAVGSRRGYTQKRSYAQKRSGRAEPNNNCDSPIGWSWAETPRHCEHCHQHTTAAHHDQTFEGVTRRAPAAAACRRSTRPTGRARTRLPGEGRRSSRPRPPVKGRWEVKGRAVGNGSGDAVGEVKGRRCEEAVEGQRKGSEEAVKGQCKAVKRH